LYKLFYPLRFVLALISLLIWIPLLVLLFHIARLIGYQQLDKIPRLFHRGCCRIFRIKMHSIGELSSHTPTLFVGNHISYLDVFVLGGLIPGHFIAKSDVASWPVLGSLAKLQNTLFFERRSGRAAEQISIMQQHLRESGNLILFPEGTSTYGTSVRPFKSSLFKAADISDEDVLIQPFMVSYTHCRGRPMTAEFRDSFAWYDTMPFGSHFVRALSAPPAKAQIAFAPTVRLADFESRKDCAKYCEQEVARMLAASLSQGQELDDVATAEV